MRHMYHMHQMRHMRHMHHRTSRGQFFQHEFDPSGELWPLGLTLALIYP
jgi:hypothetical protein